MKPGVTGSLTAGRHEWAVLASAHRALPVLLLAARAARPLRKFPGLGWVVGDPKLARSMLIEGATYTMVGEGGVAHLWQQVLGDWVVELFDGPGHHRFRAQVRELFTEKMSGDLVERVAGERLGQLSADLVAGRTVDIAEFARGYVGRIVADLLGVPVAHDDMDPDRPYRAVFGQGERLATLAIGTARSTTLGADTIASAQDIVRQLIVGVEAAYNSAGPDTMLGRCRELGVPLAHAQGLSTLLMVAGTETAASAMSRTIALLHDTGEQHALMADPQLMETAVREGLRVTSPAPLIGRSVAKTIQVAGRTLVAGDQVKLVTWTMNNAPGGFSLSRPYLPDNRQLWFGGGRHLCLGAQLARAEIGALLAAVCKPGRPIEIVRRRYARRVLIPSYAELRIRLA